MTDSVPAAAPARFHLVRPFVGPVFDLLLIGGGLSLIVGFAAMAFGFREGDRGMTTAFMVMILFSNSAHFAASTVRLYTKPGAREDLPFLTMVFPLVTLAIVTLFVGFADVLGRHLFALYATWSPYHYAAQTYGLALMYAYRGGCAPAETDRKLLRATCLLPFAWAFLNGANSGLGWFVPVGWFDANPGAGEARAVASRVLSAVVFAAPALLFARLALRHAVLPFISMLIVFVNAIWWIVFPFQEAFLWATVFHGIQYLAITAIFHVKDREREDEAAWGAGWRAARRTGSALGVNIRPWAYHAVWFYAACLGLGWFLFYVWPLAYVAIGFEYSASMAMVVAAVNLHHFIVDGYIWKLRRDRNMKTVTASAGA